MKIRLYSPFGRNDLLIGDYYYSVSCAPTEADAVLYEWSPGPIENSTAVRAWYCCEPLSTSLFRDPVWRAWLSQLTTAEYLYHSHPDDRCRVPHITCITDPATRHWVTPTKGAVAVVSNTGGSPWRRSWDARLRNRLITRPEVDLFGSRAVWSTFRATVLSRPRQPANYQGKLTGLWTNPSKLDLLADYRVAVCMENTVEPHYFTEKFVDAVRAGCVPVYQAHPTVRTGPLKGARWVDPADFRFDPAETLAFALAQDVNEYRLANGAWLDSPVARATFQPAVFARIGGILKDRAAGRLR